VESASVATTRLRTTALVSGSCGTLAGDCAFSGMAIAIAAMLHVISRGMRKRYPRPTDRAASAGRLHDELTRP
jgi:biotin synthase-related radical SAM superfamily protein